MKKQINEIKRMQQLAGVLLNENEDLVGIPENLELIKRYYLSKQIEDILSVNSNINDVEKSLIDVINIAKNVNNEEDLYSMLEDFGYDEIENISDILKWDNTYK